jgi:hypothetical protein
MGKVRKRDMAATERRLLLEYLTSVRQRLEKTSNDYKLFRFLIRGVLR